MCSHCAGPGLAAFVRHVRKGLVVLVQLAFLQKIPLCVTYGLHLASMLGMACRFALSNQLAPNCMPTRLSAYRRATCCTSCAWMVLSWHWSRRCSSLAKTAPACSATQPPRQRDGRPARGRSEGSRLWRHTRWWACEG